MGQTTNLLGLSWKREDITMRTKGKWEADRGFRDCFDHSTGHYTMEDDFISVYIGNDSCDDFNPDKHDYCQVNGPNQEENAAFISMCGTVAHELDEKGIDGEKAIRMLPYIDRGYETQIKELEADLEKVQKQSVAMLLLDLNKRWREKYDTRVKELEAKLKEAKRFLLCGCSDGEEACKKLLEFAHSKPEPVESEIEQRRREKQ
jgi:hypothetical protein